jgi:hypothetical protein
MVSESNLEPIQAQNSQKSIPNLKSRKSKKLDLEELTLVDQDPFLTEQKLKKQKSDKLVYIASNDFQLKDNESDQTLIDSKCVFQVENSVEKARLESKLKRNLSQTSEFVFGLRKKSKKSTCGDSKSSLKIKLTANIDEDTKLVNIQASSHRSSSFSLINGENLEDLDMDLRGEMTDEKCKKGSKNSEIQSQG